MKSLKSKMIVPLIGLMVVMVVFITVYMSVSTANLVSDFSDERMAAATESIQAHLVAHERKTFMSAVAMSGSAEMIRLINAGVREDVWQYVFDQKTFLDVSEIIVANHQGITLARSHMRDSFGDNVSGVPSMAAGLRGEVLTLYTPTPTAPMVMTTAAPIFYGGPGPGSVVVNYTIGSNEFLDRLSFAFGVDATVFAGETRVGSTVRNPATGDRIVGTAVDPEIAEAVLRRGQSVFKNLDLFGVPYSGYYFPLHGAAGNPVGIFFVGKSRVDSIAVTESQRRNIIIIGAVSLATIAIIMLMFVVRMLRPISLLTQTLDGTAKGDLTRRLPDHGQDEIGRASRSFNQTMEELRKMIVAIKGQAENLSSIGNDLAGNMMHTASAMNEITANIHSVKGRVINQSASVTETNATMEQVTVNIDKLNGNVELQTGAVSQAASAVEEMIANIQSVTQTLVKNIANMENLKESSDTGRASLQEVAGDIQEIAKESEGLLEINAVMENIAGQTNLLSMNAAIEAARAGESGRGFAVVAGEIRQLAESSSAQSKTIVNVLKKIKESIDKITRSTDNVLNKFEAIDLGVKTVAEQEELILKAMEEQSHGSRQVLDAAGQVGDITRLVKGGSLEMLDGSKEVILESKNLEKATQEITNGVNEMASGAEQVNMSVNNVDDLTGKNRENISSLVQAVEKFKV